MLDTRTRERLSVERVLDAGTGEVSAALTRAQPTAGGVWFGFTGREDPWILSERHFELFAPWPELWE